MLHVMLVDAHVFQRLIEDSQLLVGYSCICMPRRREVSHLFRQVRHFVVALLLQCRSRESCFAGRLPRQLQTAGVGLLDKPLEVRVCLRVCGARDPFAKLLGVMATHLE